MNRNESLENLAALGCLFLFPIGCLRWINNHWNDRKKRFVFLFFWGTACLVLIAVSAIRHYVVDAPDRFWQVMLPASIIGYVVGMIAFALIGYHKHRKAYLEPTKNRTYETGSNTPL